MTWMTIEDFTPGIWNAPGLRGNFNSDNSGFAGAIIAPLGACTDASYGCLPGPGGKGLIPGFGRHANIDNTINVNDLSDANKQAPYLNGGVINHPGRANTLVAVQYRSTTGNMTTKLMYGPAYSTLARTITAASGSLIPQPLTFAPQRMATASPYTAAGQPVIGYGVASGMSEAGLFPDPTAPGVTGVAAFANAGRVLAHQNRIVLLRNETFSFGPSSLSFIGEKIDFTDPPNSNVMGTQNQVFGPENPSGYGAWGSLSASSLLLIKARGGAVLVEGDIAAPRITNLPGVQSTLQMGCVAAVTPVGIVYFSEGQGVWAWNGGATSQKLSPQLDDYFYRHLQTTTKSRFDADKGPSTGLSPRAGFLDFGNVLLASGGWMLHYGTGGWWRLSDPTADEFLWYTDAYSATIVPQLTMSAWHPEFVNTSGTTYRMSKGFDATLFAQKWHWHSHPIRVTADKDVNIKNIVIEALAYNGSGTQTIDWVLHGSGGSTQTGTATITSSARPQKILIPCSIDGDSIEISLTGNNDTTFRSAPTLVALHIEFLEANQTPVQ